MKNHMKRTFFSLFLNIILFVCLFGNPVASVPAQTIDVSLGNLTRGAKLSGFRTEAVYLNESDQPMGARLIHERTGFMLDLLEIQSVPQTYIWVNSFPNSDQGEPHTQEHLLITKGNKGRNLNAELSMSLAQSNASTYQYYTVYHLNTAGGSEVFYSLVTNYMDALLHPDYTEEEVRREVRNWGVAENPDKTLRLDEKGSVYNEMVSSMNNPGARAYRALGSLILGTAHPLSFNSGGSPEGIRRMQANDIRRFHAENYHLGNMGAIVSVPKDMTPGSVLNRMNAILNKLEPKSEKRDFMSLEKLPPMRPAEAGKFQVVEYPNRNQQQPGSMRFAFPANLSLDLTEKIALDKFLRVFLTGPNSNLYKKLVDSKTREIDLGATSIFGFRDNLLGNPVFIELSDVAAAHLTEEKASLVRQKIAEEFSRVAAFKDNSPELKEFNERFANALVEYRRSLSKFVNTPPGFGFRSGGNGYGWLWQTKHLSETEDFRKSVTYKPQIAEIERMLASGKNIWRVYINKWKFAATRPYAVVARANPGLIEQDAAERKARADAEIAVLKQKYNVADEQAAIRLYRAEYDAKTLELEKLEKSSARKFLENPPLTLDDPLDYKVSSIGTVQLVASNFENMSGATAGIALRTDVIPEDELVYLSLMPALLRSVGVVRGGTPLSFEEMSEQLRREILSLNLSFTGNIKTNRYELIARGAGNDTAESRRAIEWMRLVLQNPNWRTENLPRIRDVVDQQLAGLRRTMQGSEESWVHNPANAYMAQNNPVHLATLSFLTQVHNAHRLRWMLKDAGNSENQTAISAYLMKLASAKGNREELKTFLAAVDGNKEQAGKISDALKPLLEDFTKLPAAARNLAVEAAKDLGQTLNDIPDSSLAADWAYLSNQIRQDLLQTPAQTLAKLEQIRSKLLNTGNARMFVIGSRDTQAKLEANFKNLLSGFDNAPVNRIPYAKTRRIDERVKTRNRTTENPVFVGLRAPNMTGGVFINQVPFVSYADTDREKLLDFLASKLYGGSGAHSVYTKTLNAGLAYSNGIGSNPASGLFLYYAERTPELPQTLGYIVQEIKKPLNDPGLSEYTIASSFSSRAASPYEQRGEAMAADLADGLTPETVARFRRGILELRKMPNLAEELYKRKDKVYAPLLPGYGIKGKTVAGANYFVIGAEKQMSAYETYLKSSDAAESSLYRLYPRDYWILLK
jgi:Zn-dependent M16 (insulinase) family peptidase